MPPTTEMALVSVPLAVYCYVLGRFHGGRSPRVVAGSADLAALMGGLSGLIAVGPVGRLVVAALFGPRATPGAWVVWDLCLVVGLILVARKGRHRVVVYHAEPEPIRAAIGRVLAASGAPFAATLQGYEDRVSQTGVIIRASRRMRTAVIEVQGRTAGPVTTALRLGLRADLRRVDQPGSAISTGFFMATGLFLVAPVVGFLAFDPHGRRVVRTVGRWLGWG